jgi:hypothetical protein
MSIITGTIQKRRGTAAAWVLANPLLLEGEEGYETDTGKTKMGDGVTLWNGLPYNGTAQQQSGLVSGGAISTGVFGGNNVRVASAVWYIFGFGSFSTVGNTDFNVALSSAGNVRYVDFYGDALGVISKVEGVEAATASHPAAPADSALVGSILVTDGAIAPVVDLSAYATKIYADNAAAAAEASAKAYADTGDTAAMAYADSLVLGLYDDRGTFDASVNTFPASGGSGPAGAIKKGDVWTVSVAGVLGGSAVTAGDTVRALIDTPGQTAGNWAIAETNIGFVPENSTNKDISGGYVGKTLEKINFWNTARTFMSFLVNAATGAWTYTFPNRSGTIADDTDLALKFNTSDLDTDATLAANSDLKGVSQKAVKTYIDKRRAFPPIFSGSWRGAPGTAANTSGNFDGFIWYSPYVVSLDHTVTKIRIRVTTAVGGSNIRLALYADDGAGKPGALVEDSGNLSSASTGEIEFTFTTPRSLAGQLYHMGFQASAAGVAINFFTAEVYFLPRTGANQLSAYRQVQAFGAFPANATPLGVGGGNQPMVELLVQ